MGRITYSTAYPSSNPSFASSSNRVWTSKLTGEMPSNGAVRLFTYSIATVGINAEYRGISVTVQMILTDGSGHTVTLSDTITTPTSAPLSITLTAVPSSGTGFDWGNIQYIQLVGPSGIATRQGTNFIYVDYITPCGAPSNVQLSNTISSGYEVTLSWSAGASGDGNAATGYEVARRESSDGSTWGSLESYAQTTSAAYTSVLVPPPDTFGHYYRYYVRTLGEAGAAYASGYAVCGQLLQKARPALGAYTDPVLIAGQTRVKAAHMTELQANINIMRQAYGYAAYSFTAIRAGYTSLGGWLTHVLEMRAAIDALATAHEAWIMLEENRPSAAVIEQLRRVVANL